MFKWLYKKQKPGVQPEGQKEQPKDKYLLVKSTSLTVKTDLHEGTLYFYLFENEGGDRKLEHKLTIPASNNFDNIVYYAETLYPWLKGKDFKDIPSYWDIVKERRPNDIQMMYKRYFGK